MTADTRAENAIEEANAHLGAALAQVSPSDDKIIVEHLRAARELLNGPRHPTGSEEFAAQLEHLGVPAPWRLDDEEIGLILAANGEMACAAGFDHMPLPDEDRTAFAMYIILAVNTLAGFKAEFTP